MQLEPDAYHHQNAEVTRAESLANVHLLPVGVHARLLVEQILDGLVAGEDDQNLGTENQAVDGAIFTSPLLKLKMGILRGHLDIADVSWDCGWVASNVSHIPGGGFQEWEVLAGLGENPLADDLS